ncbi:MAG: hypothetical protein ABIK92_07865 [Pseudomonadota bacterium]
MIKKYLVIGLFAVSVLFTIPLSAAENVKIKLPDGIYMYASLIGRLKDGSDRVGFMKYFVVYNKNIYSSKDFVKKFGISKLNTLSGGNKKNIIILGGEVIGIKYNLRFKKAITFDKENATFVCDEAYFTKNIKEGPAYYWPEIMYPRLLASATKCLAVPEEYKEVKKNVYTAIPQEEVDKIAKLAKEKLLPLLINRKGFAKYKIREMELFKENLWILDKISYQNHELYIGEYQYGFKGAETSYHFHIIFSATKDNMHIVTTNYEEGDLVAGYMETYGMLDFDGCGNDELVIEKEAPREDETTIWLEIHKQKPDGNWMIIKVVKTRRIL